MKKFNYFFAVILSTVLILVGCQGNNNSKNNQPAENTKFENTRYNDGTGTGTVRDGKRNFGTRDGIGNRNGTVMDGRDGDFTQRVRNRNNDTGNLNRSTNNTQDRYGVSKEAADRIVDEIAEIDQAYVLTSRNNAYVAATLDNNRETRRNNTATDRRNNSTSMNIRNSNDRSVKNRTVNQVNANNRGQDNHITNRRGNTDGEELTNEVKNQITDIVQSVDNNIDNVYVSTSPDFFDLTNNYVDDMNNGRPVRGFFDQIGNTIERIFPQNKR